MQRAHTHKRTHISHSCSLSSSWHAHCLVYFRVSACNTAYNQAWHTSPLTLRQCVSSEPAVITTVDPLLTHDCLGTRTTARHLRWMELGIQKIEHSVLHLSTVCLHRTNSHTCGMILICLTNHSGATHWFDKSYEESAGGESTKRLLGLWRALVLMEGGFTCSLLWSSNGAVRHGIKRVAYLSISISLPSSLTESF